MRTLSNVEPEQSLAEFGEAVMDYLNDDSVPDNPNQVEDTARMAPATEEEQPALTADAAGNLHDENGKFAGRAPAEEEQEEQEETEQPEEESPVDETETDELPEEFELDLSNPDVVAYLGKYGNDIGEALKGAVEAQKLIGRRAEQSPEFQAMQAQMAEMRQMLEAQNNRPAPLAPIDWESAIERDPQRAAFAATERRDVNALVAACDVWGEEEPFKASTYLANTLNEWRLETMAHEFAAQRETSAQPQSSEDQEIAKVLAKHPDLERPEVLAEVGQVLQERPTLKRMLESGTPEDKAAALEDAYVIARSRGTDTSDAVRRVQTQVSEEGRRARTAAKVVSASRGSAASATQPTRVEVFGDAFDAHLRRRGLMGSDEQSG